MRRLAAIAAIGASALAGCGIVSVSSNDSATQNAIDAVESGASDFANGAGNVAAEAGDELGNAARDTGDTLGNIADSLKDGDGEEAK